MAFSSGQVAGPGCAAESAPAQRAPEWASPAPLVSLAWTLRGGNVLAQPCIPGLAVTGTKGTGPENHRIMQFQRE